MKFFWHEMAAAAVMLTLLAPGFARADSGSDVVVIYNKNLPASKMVAEYYAAARQVPKKQIYGFDLTTNEVMVRAEFRNSLQMPLARKLEDDGLWKFGKTTLPAANGQPARVVRRVAKSKIRYAVLCYGVPLKIAADSDLSEMPPADLKPEFRRNDASVDSELAWLPLVEDKAPLTGPMVNWTYGVTNAALLDPTNGILLVARLDGPTPEIAVGLVDKSLQAERDGLWGRGYFDARGLEKSDAYSIGDEWILGAAEIWSRLGFETVVDTNAVTFPADFPMPHIAVYCGWYDGNVSGPFTLPKVEFMPGAFAYHLHSFSAATIRDPNNNWVGPLLAKGATCTMGCVNEPYLSLTPNIAAFIARFVAGGFSFGEAAWSAQPALSWQTTVVGDPLYRPFGKSPPELHRELLKRNSPLIEWSWLHLVDTSLVRGAPLMQLSAFLENLPATTNSAILTEKLAQLYAAQGKMNSAIEADQKALQLHPSPEERIGLRLALAQKLLAHNLDADARTDYQQLLAEAPNYPGRAAIEEKIKMLIQKNSTGAPLIQKLPVFSLPRVQFGNTNGFGSEPNWNSGFAH